PGCPRRHRLARTGDGRRRRHLAPRQSRHSSGRSWPPRSRPTRPHPPGGDLTIDPATTSSGLVNKIAAGAAGFLMLVVLLAAGAGAGVSSLLSGGDSIPHQIAHDIISAAC